VTTQEAIAIYRLLSPQLLEQQLQKDAEFKAAFEAAVNEALKSGDQTRYFWSVDAEGWAPGVFNRPIPPARPGTGRDDVFGPGGKDREAKLLPLPGAAFPS